MTRASHRPHGEFVTSALCHCDRSLDASRVLLLDLTSLSAPNTAWPSRNCTRTLFGMGKLIDALCRAIPSTSTRKDTQVLPSKGTSFLIPDNEKSFHKQYANIYYLRLHSLRDSVIENAQRKWKDIEGAGLD